MPARNYAQLPDADKLHKAATALDALLDEPEIAGAMTPRKYTKSGKVAEGRALLAAALAALEVQTEETGDKVLATDVQTDELGEAHGLYAALAGTARAVYMDDRAARVALGLTGTHDKSYVGRVRRMRDFVIEARKPHHLARFADESDVDAEELDTLEAALDEASARISGQDVSAIRAKGSTDGREAALAALVKWMLKMHGHARVVLKGRPDLLEMLGIPRR
ncbi:MAG TPA: hypothetical protein VGB53_11090 [Rubricoccaceae bacterium]|jgi:hypothetical protein